MINITKKPIYILGLNFAYHELSACILKNGKLLAAVEEERFSRIKRGKKALIDNPDVLPGKSIEYCLKVAGISLPEINHVGLSFYPEDRLKNINACKHFSDVGWGSEQGEKLFYTKIRSVPSLLNKLAGVDLSDKIVWIPHHICHAASSFFVSPFKESAILSIDGIGEFSSTWLGIGKGNEIKAIKEIMYPNSIGFLWEKISMFLGFSEYDSSKVMGLSAYGNPERFYKAFQRLVTLKDNGEFEVDNEILRFRLDDFVPMEKLFGVKKINSPSEIRKDQEDIAAALQKITNQIIVHLSDFLKKETKLENFSLAGGVALNCISNGLLMSRGLFKYLYIQPAANDAGTALGAAYYIWNQTLKKRRSFYMNHVYWGPEYTDQEIKSSLEKGEVSFYKSKNLPEETAQKISEGNIVGWFQGRMEWGPRALGNRSLLADPRKSDMKQILNERIKRREPFRPFAPSVLAENASEWFTIPKKCNSVSTEFMEINFDVRKEKLGKVPAITHEDGTSRIQIVNKKTNSKYHQLIKSFYKITGIPMVLNTSFNDNEPIVCSPEDAIQTFLRTKMDYLAIGDYLVKKKPS